MQSRILTCITAMTLFAALAISARLRLAAQENAGQTSKPKHHHYKFIDIGSLGGPNSYFSSAGFGAQVLNGQGMVAGYGDTTAPDPYAPNCFDLDCFLAHAFRWQNGEKTDMGALPPGVNNSAVTMINASGSISGFSENGQIDPLLGFPESEAVYWKGNQIVPLGTLGGNESLGLALNDRGQVVGVAANAISDSLSMFGWGTQMRVFLWGMGS